MKDVSLSSTSAEQSNERPPRMSPLPPAVQTKAPVATMVDQSPHPKMPGCDLAEPVIVQQPHTQTDQISQSINFITLAATADSLLQNSPNVPTNPQPAVERPSSPLDELTEEEDHMRGNASFPPLKVDPDFPISTQHQPPASSLVSPPASTHTDHGSNTSNRSRRDSSTISSALTSRHSSRQPKPVQHYTPESGFARRSSTASVSARLQERESGSPSVVGSAIKKARRGSRLSSEIVADEESLRLIRELQAQDRGLRRRI